MYRVKMRRGRICAHALSVIIEQLGDIDFPRWIKKPTLNGKIIMDWVEDNAAFITQNVVGWNNQGEHVHVRDIATLRVPHISPFGETHEN